MGGGGGSSSSSQATTTTSTDARVVGGNDSVNISSANSTITLVDRGAVNSAFGFAREVTAGAFEFATASQMQAERGMEHALDEVSEAYSTAKAGEQKVFAGAALAIVGVVAFAAFKR